MQVNITKRIDTPKGKRYCPIIVGPNGRIKPDWVTIDDRPERHPEGTYYLDWTEDGKRTRISVGSDATAAYNSRVRKQRELDALASGLIISNPIEDDSRLRISSAVDDFLEEIQLSRQRKTWMGYIVSLRYFQESCSKRFLEEVSIYEEEELSKLHAVCSPYHSTLYDFLLMSSFREQEAMHVTWNNVRMLPPIRFES